MQCGFSNKIVIHNTNLSVTYLEEGAILVVFLVALSYLQHEQLLQLQHYRATRFSPV